MLVLDEAHTNHHRSAAETQFAAPAPRPPSNDGHSTAEAPEKHQGAGIPPLCLSTNTALPLARIPLTMVQSQHRQSEKNKPQNLQNLPSQPEFILSGLSSK